MGTLIRNLNIAVAAVFALLAFSAPLPAAETERLARMLGELHSAEPAQARRIAKEIELEWSKSGSAAMDLLLRRGRDALDADDSRAAAGFFTALTDHAPDFAEGWHMRAVAYARAELYGPALANLERALALNPHHYNAIFSLGSLMEEIGRPGMARDAYARALAIHPHHEALNAAMARVRPKLDGADL